MQRRYFGTDGIRGPVGGELINPDFARRLGAAAGLRLREAHPEPSAPTVAIAWDTRASGPELARALAEGFCSTGILCRLLGVLPTPVVSHHVANTACGFGAVVSASHNPATDNGIKFFSGGGRKLSDDEEAAIEACLDRPIGTAARGGIETEAGAAAAYLEHAMGLLPEGALAGWTIAMDAANGAMAAFAPALFRRLGADVRAIGVHPDGNNINADTGSEHPEGLCRLVKETRARFGAAFDGDGDRLVLCDEKGELVDGDELLAVLGTHALDSGRLAASTLVVTRQSNLALDVLIRRHGGRVLRTDIGDRHVKAGMEGTGSNLGGENSGHIIYSDHSPTGDGLAAAIKAAEVMRDTGLPLSALRGRLVRYPQATRSLRVSVKKPETDLTSIAACIAAIEKEAGDSGRVMVRYSGTEPKIRLLAEGKDPERVTRWIEALDSATRRDLDVLES